jgi:hypothetical protein
MQNHLDTLLFVANFIVDWFNHPYVMAFVPAGLVGLLVVYELFTEGRKDHKPLHIMPYFCMSCMWAALVMPHDVINVHQIVLATIGSLAWACIVGFITAIIPLVIYSVGYMIFVEPFKSHHSRF